MTLQCPGCQGRHLGDWQFEHRDGCEAAAAELATEQADLAQLQPDPGRAIRRPATAIERTVIETAGLLRRGQVPNTTVALNGEGGRDRSVCGWEDEHLLWLAVERVG